MPLVRGILDSETNGRRSVFKLSQSRNFGWWVGRTSSAFNVAPSSDQTDDVTSVCRGDITDCGMGALPRALNFGKCFFLPLSFQKKAASLRSIFVVVKPRQEQSEGI
jgi:hypothetical protein